MNITVCVKQVPDTTEIRIDPEKGTLIREGVPSILNPDDANAVEAALQIKDQFPGTVVTVLTMGPAQAQAVLRECLAMGADRAILLSDRAFAGSDTWATANALCGAIRKIGDPDIILTGRQAIDGDTAQVGPQIAANLGLAQVTYVMKLDFLDEESILVRRQLEDGYEDLEVKLPALLTAVKEWNTPRYRSIGSIVDAYRKKIEVWSISDVDVAPATVGLKASPTRVFASFTPEKKGKGKVLTGQPREMVSALLGELKHRQLAMGGHL